VSRKNLLTQLKSNKVGIDREMMSRVTSGEKLSRRAVVKEQRIGQVCLQQRRQSPIKT